MLFRWMTVQDSMKKLSPRSDFFLKCLFAWSCTKFEVSFTKFNEQIPIDTESYRHMWGWSHMLPSPIYYWDIFLYGPVQNTWLLFPAIFFIGGLDVVLEPLEEKAEVTIIYAKVKPIFFETKRFFPKAGYPALYRELYETRNALFTYSDRYIIVNNLNNKLFFFRNTSYLV